VVKPTAGMNTNCNMNNYSSGLRSLSSDCLRFEQSANSITNCDVADDDQTGLCVCVSSVN